MTRRWGLLVAVLLVAAVALGMADVALANGHGLNGVWSVQVTILSACGPGGVPVGGLPSIITFTRDGKVIETPGSLLVGPLPVLRVSPGLGAWQHEGGRHYTGAFTFFRVNVPANTFAGTQKITEAIELSKDADEFTAAGTSEVFDTNGNLVSTGCNTLTGTRID
jgi:hypothetical protein